MHLRPGRVPFLFAAAALAATPAYGQVWPARPIRVFLPQPAGAGVDIVLRKAIEDMQPRLGQPLIVENRPGGNSVVAAEACAHAAPDGYTICVLNSDPLVVNPHLFSKLPYDAQKDFRPITSLYYILTGMFVKASAPVNSVKELAAYAAARPGKLNIGTFGPKSSPDMSRLLMGERWNTSIVGIPYKGGPQIFQGLAAGEIDIVLIGAYGGLGLLKAGKAKLLAVSGSRRLSMFPEVPTLEETGLGDLPSGQSWWGLLGPAAIPDPIARRLNSEFVRTFRDPKFMEFLNSQVTEPNVGAAEAFADTIRRDTDRVGRFVKRYKIAKE
ncbi:MAG: tripartite tricarboxylate transporter substrate binding protein [Burkholderiales bacterium]|nr:tripartite tricarboxylate transporter substrate binding protein [Burkholderiales bacterium]